MQILRSLLRLSAISIAVLLVAYTTANLNPSRSASSVPADSDPWAASETISASDFTKEIQSKRDPSLNIIYVGVRTLYSGAHIPGSSFYGPGSTDQGIADLKKFAATLPKNANIVIYCGCCPLDRCPNLRPAFSALHEMGFIHLRVLLLPTSFAADWIEKGYPVAKGS